ncbi:MAG: hypothetical protein JXQ74_00060 [Alphaproteobacteria bacterium]|nr:hypothetical protein [Alphaproteobacteria bacterium]
MKLFTPFLTLATLILAQSASADFLLHPQKIVFQGPVRSEAIQVTNTDTKPKTYKMSFVEYYPQENGGYRIVEKRDGRLVFVDPSIDPKTKQKIEKITPLTTEQTKTALFASDVVDYSPRKIVLKPRETQTVRLMLNRKARFNDARELRSHFHIQEKDVATEAKPAGQSAGIVIDIQAEYGITIPIIARFGDTSVKSTFESVKLTRDEKGKAMLNFTLTRQGTQSIRGNIIAYKEEGFLSSDTEIGRISNIALYTNLNQKSFSIPLHIDGEEITPSDLEGETLILKFTGDKKDSPDINFKEEFEL